MSGDSQTADGRMSELEALPRSIAGSVMQTFKLYAELLAPITDSLIKPVEHSYGPGPRHKVDCYMPAAEVTSKVPSAPVVVFVHGGGLDKGDKRLPMIRGAHQNVGTFFARNGFLALVTNYHLVAPGTEHSAVFPSGGYDLSLLVDWISTSSTISTHGGDPSSVFLIGNSAGAVHVATYLYANSATLSQLSTPLTADVPRPLAKSASVKGAILVGMPADFPRADDTRKATLENYFSGGPEAIDDRCPRGLREKSKDRTPLLIMTADLEPEDEILQPVERFCDAVKALSDPPRMDRKNIAKHNHISTPLGLGLGGSQEQWGLDAVEWMRAQLDAEHAPARGRF